MSEAILSATGLGRVFKIQHKGRKQDLHAVTDLDLELHTGRTLGVVGESGCGKTTLNRILLLLDTPTTGEVWFKGKACTTLSGEARREFRRAVQPVFQNPFSSLDPRMRVGKIIAEPLSTITGMSRSDIEKRVGEVLEAVGLQAADARRFPNEFSGGQRQRIAIARAIASKPEVLMLDEPVSSQDISIRAQILNILKDLQAEYGLGCVFISHDLATVRFMADDVIVMYLGRVIEKGTAQAICSTPAHPYTKALLAAALPPDPDAPRPELPPQGEIPSPLDPPSGCPYHTRCPLKFDRCETVRPPMFAAPHGGAAACHLLDPEIAQ
ncbi:ABC transporter ATP-binding protein [Pelagibacterium limicola]|uniref:ABC transporter ATP-binding protein n=1 Tax=Pelagibacterium limicola TaxID=2791022 RepID=UPI0018B00C87|nr:oligopeptide/dipeptide ABC transporter ATP-binding protein [Pelagibacterium limicola]